MQSYDKKLNDKLFDVDFQSNFSEELVESLASLAEELIQKYGDEVVLKEWTNYLNDSINDQYSARNFAYAFFNYGGHNLKVKDPYPFLGLLFYKVGFSFHDEPKTNDENDFFDLLDSIYTSLLLNAGIISEDDYFYVNVYQDLRLKSIVEMLQKNRDTI